MEMSDTPRVRGRVDLVGMSEACAKKNKLPNSLTDLRWVHAL